MGVFFLLPPRAAPWGCLQGADMTQHLAVLLHGLDQVLNENILFHGQLPPDNGLFGHCRPGRPSGECLQGADVTQHLTVLLHGLDQVLNENILLHGQLPPDNGLFGHCRPGRPFAGMLTGCRCDPASRRTAPWTGPGSERNDSSSWSITSKSNCVPHMAQMHQRMLYLPGIGRGIHTRNDQSSSGRCRSAPSRL